VDVRESSVGYRETAALAHEATYDEPRRRIRVLLVEDHLVLREGLKSLLEIDRELEIVGEAGTADEALRIAERESPDIVLSDIALPDRSGISLIAELRALGIACQVVMLTAYKTEEYIRAALDAGASGYILKDASCAELVLGLRLVASGRKFLCQAIGDMLLFRYMSPDQKPVASPMAALTKRETEVLTRIARGESNKQMARVLTLSVKTVEKHRSNLMRKLMLHNTAEVTLFAIRNGLVNRY
jgi:DNA-binding NarL/FixJ family response regulator